MDKQSIIDAAVSYASRGWRVLPVLGKMPNCGKAWEEKATNEADAVSALFNRLSFDGVGVRLGQSSGIVDIECDDEEAEDVLLDLLDGEEPNTPCFQSARGKHFLFAWEPGIPNSHKAKYNLESLEFRVGGEAAQSVFPPSGERIWIINAGTQVQRFKAWDRVIARLENNAERKAFPNRGGGSLSPFYGDGSTLDVPRWLTKHGREIIGTTTGGDGVHRWHIECPNIEKHTGPNAWRDCCVTQSPDGTLGGCCFHTSCGMSDWATLRDTIGPLTYDDYEEPTPKPLVDFSGFKAKGKSEAKPAEYKPRSLPRFAAIPNDLLMPPGLIGDVVEYTLQTSRYPQPELALAGALALMSVITGRKVQDESGTRTNIYIMGLCPAAAGKEQARSVNKEILALTGGDNLLGPESIGSSAGILSVLSESPATLFQLDEIGKMFVLMHNPKAGHLYKIGSELLKLYSSASGTYKGDAYADTKKIKKISQPHACIYGTSTPEVFWGSITAENVREGLVGRFLAFDSDGYVEPKKKRQAEIPGDILARVRWWIDFIPGGGGNLSSLNYKPITIPFAAGVEERIDKHITDIHSKRLTEDPIRAAIWSRSAEKAAKLALMFACSRAVFREPGTIEMQDADRGIALANRLTKRMLDRIEDHVSDGEHDAKVKKVLRIIAGELTLTEFTRKTQFLRDRRERNEILSHLVEIGAVVCEKKQGEGDKPITLVRRTSPYGP